jgi:prolyl oligopeptidase PreP (S9A serine peptidase family)
VAGSGRPPRSAPTCAARRDAVPLLDMVRYRFLIRLWIPEYGDPTGP